MDYSRWALRWVGGVVAVAALLMVGVLVYAATRAPLAVLLGLGIAAVMAGPAVWFAHKADQGSRAV